MLMGHPPQRIACGRDNAPQGCFEGLTPVQVSMIVQELVACDSKCRKRWLILLKWSKSLRRPDQIPSIVLQCTHVPAGSRGPLPRLAIIASPVRPLAGQANARTPRVAPG